MNNTNLTIPEGYRMNAQGNLVALSNIKAVDALRDEQVQDMIKKARSLQQQMLQFKLTMMEQIDNFLDLSAAEYQVKRGGNKGNVTLTSFDGRQKVQLAVSDCISFDERLQIAKGLIHECITDWSQGANDNIRTLVDQAFEVDKAGNISTAKVLSLRRLDINDARWDKAMQAIADSVTVTDSKNYLRFYERLAAHSRWQAIPLDLAAL